jgi:signal transduction histidine kinase
MKKINQSTSLPKQWLVGLILLIGILGSAGAYWALVLNQRSQLQDSMKQRSSQWATEWVSHWGLILDDLERTFMMQVPPQDVRLLDNDPALIKLQNRNPALERLTWVPLVREGERNGWQAAGWRFMDWTAGNDWNTTPTRPTYSPMAWSRPAQTEVLGWDMRSTPNVAAVLDAASTGGGLRLSSPQTWPNRGGRGALSSGTYIVVAWPVFRSLPVGTASSPQGRQLVGHWVAWVSAQQVWPEAVGRAQAEGIRIDVLDPRDLNQNRVWSSVTERVDPETGKVIAETAISENSVDVPIQVGEQLWQMRVSLLEPISATGSLGWPLWMAALGVVFSVMLAILTQTKRRLNLEIQDLSLRLDNVNQAVLPTVEGRMRVLQIQQDHIWAHVPLGMALVMEGVIKRTNPKLLAVLGVPEHTDLVGESPINWFASEASAEVFEHEAAAAIERTHLYMAQAPLRTVDGREILATITITSFPSEGATHSTTLWFLEDCSTQAELMSTQRRASALTAQVESQQAALTAQTAETTQTKKALLISLNEDLRQPLNTLLGRTHSLSQLDLDDSARSAVTQIQAVGKRLLRISNDLLDMAKSHSGGLVLDVSIFAVRDLLLLIQELTQDGLQQAGAVLEYDAGDCSRDASFIGFNWSYASVLDDRNVAARGALRAVVGAFRGFTAG